VNLLIPPPVALAIIAAAMWGFDRIFDEGRITGGWRIPVAILLLVASTLLMSAAVATMLRARTTIDPRKPSRTTRLVTTGVFRLSRNPIYLADVLLLAALAVWLGQPANAALLAVFVWYIDRFQIRAEEQALRTLFGADYAAWCNRVRRWL
jgi:protein-S-isoprenylcysteine O-methyltransferase Ste14